MPIGPVASLPSSRPGVNCRPYGTTTSWPSWPARGTQLRTDRRPERSPVRFGTAHRPEAGLDPAGGTHTQRERGVPGVPRGAERQARLVGRGMPRNSVPASPTRMSPGGGGLVGTGPPRAVGHQEAQAASSVRSRPWRNSPNTRDACAGLRASPRSRADGCKLSTLSSISTVADCGSQPLLPLRGGCKR